MFEYIFNESDKEEGGNRDVVILASIESDIKFDCGIEAQLHQADVGVDEIEFLFQADGCGSVVEDIAEKAAEFVDSRLGFLRGDCDEGVD